MDKKLFLINPVFPVCGLGVCLSFMQIYGDKK